MSQFNIINYITPLSNINSVVVFSFPEPFAPWRWYDTGTYPTFTTGTLYISEAENLEKRVQLLSSYDYILVFDHLRTLTDPHDTLIHSIQNLGYSVVEFIDYPAIGFVRVYAKPEALLSSHIEI